MARTVVKPAHDNASGSDTGMPKTIPPTRPARLGPDVISTPRQPRGGSQYGQNQFGGRSSTSPGEMVRSPLATSIKDASERGSDAVLDSIIEKGTADAAADQLRKVDPTPYPTAHGMRNRSGEK